MICIEELVLLNQYAQDILKIDDGKAWFNSLSPKEQHELLRELSNLIIQAGVKDSDVNVAIKKSGLKPTYTPCVLLQKGNLKCQLAKTLSLPIAEYAKTFSLFINLLSIADKRRRETRCKNECSHWWHKDLSNEEVVNLIKNSGESLS